MLLLHISIRSWIESYREDFSIQLLVVVVGRRCTTASNSHRFPKIMPPKSLDGDSARDNTISRAKDGKGPFNMPDLSSEINVNVALCGLWGNN